MDRRRRTDTSSAQLATPVHIDTEVLVASCLGVVTVPEKELSEFHRGYEWAATLFVILFGLVLSVLEMVSK